MGDLFLLIKKRLYASLRGRNFSKTLYHLDVILLKINKIFLCKKIYRNDFKKSSTGGTTSLKTVYWKNDFQKKSIFIEVVRWENKKAEIVYGETTCTYRFELYIGHLIFFVDMRIYDEEPRGLQKSCNF
jgi:hypothetical protein